MLEATPYGMVSSAHFIEQHGEEVYKNLPDSQFMEWANVMYVVIYDPEFYTD